MNRPQSLARRPAAPVSRGAEASWPIAASAAIGGAAGRPVRASMPLACSRPSSSDISSGSGTAIVSSAVNRDATRAGLPSNIAPLTSQKIASHRKKVAGAPLVGRQLAPHAGAAGPKASGGIPTLAACTVTVSGIGRGFGGLSVGGRRDRPSRGRRSC